MSVFAKLMRKAMLARCQRIDYAVTHAVQEQYATLSRFLEDCRNTAFGRRYGLRGVRNVEQFARQVPRFDYDSFSEAVNRMRAGESGVTYPERVRMFAVSSGSTSSRSKYIPVTSRSMHRNHLQGMADVVSMYLRANPSSRLFEGRTLTMGGSCRIEHGALVGDLSALTISSVGRLAGVVRAPSLEVALLENFEAKCEAVCRECVRQNIVAMAGVPSWTMALLRRVLDYTGQSSVVQVWRAMELFMHGGVSFRPYRSAFAQIMGEQVKYLESYNASEGFVAIADECGCEDMLLMPHYGCYYEFVHGGDVVPLEGVRTNVDYSLLMTSENGLWRYELGDVVRFSSLDPYRLRIVGRTKQYINAFGEELMEGNVEAALLRSCMVAGAVVEDYTISPVFNAGAVGGYHRWVVEFIAPPCDVPAFAKELDDALREENSDYDAKRRSIMSALHVEVVSRGTFHRWQGLRLRRKVPHMTSDSNLSDDILSCVER